MIDPADHLLPVGEPSTKSDLVLGKPSPQAQSWGVVISIVVIVAMVVIGAFYSWGKRIAEEKALYGAAQATSTEQF